MTSTPTNFHSSGKLEGPSRMADDGVKNQLAYPECCHRMDPIKERRDGAGPRARGRARRRKPASHARTIPRTDVSRWC